MRQDSWILSTLRMLCLLFGVFFLGMLYWSSNNLEQSVIDVRQELKSIKTDLARNKVNRHFESEEKVIPQSSTSKTIKSDRPNLLSEDPYLTKTLPSLLPQGFQVHGMRHESMYLKFDTLSPFNGFAEVGEWNRMCGVSVARQKFGIYETLAPDMGLRMEVGDTPLEYIVYLRDDVYWQPLEKSWFPADFKLAPQFLEKNKVTSHDFKFMFDISMNESLAQPGAIATRGVLADIDKFDIIDDYTFKIVWKKDKYISKNHTASLSPFPRFVYQYFADGSKIVENDSDPDNYRKNPIWALNFTNHWAKNIIVGCGSWLFDGMTDKVIKFKRNPDFFYQDDVLVDHYEYEFKASPEGVWQDFKEAKTDAYQLTPQQKLEFSQFLKSSLYQKQVEQNKKIISIEYVSKQFAFIAWNTINPLFNSKKVRQALTLAIDRERIIRQTLNGQGVMIHGYFSLESPSNDKTIEPWPFDPEKAKRLLAEEGWVDSEGKGILYKEINGTKVPFQFKLTYFVKNTNSKAIVEYVVTALQAVGIKVDMKGLDIADLSREMDDKTFDAIYLGWGLGSPPEDPRQLWHSSGAGQKGSSNLTSFQNDEADEIIEKLDIEKDQEKRLSLYHRFDAILHEEQPYVFLYNPKQTLLYREWLQNVFIPSERQDLIPGANVTSPQASSSWFVEGFNGAVN